MGLIFCSILFIAVLYFFRIMPMIEHIYEFKYLNNTISSSTLNIIQENFYFSYIMVGFFGGIYSLAYLGYFCFNFLYNLHKIFYWKYLIIQLLFIVILEFVCIYLRHKEDYKNHKRVKNLIHIKNKVENSIRCLEQEIADIKKDRMIEESSRVEQIDTLKDTITMLKKIYGEISFSLEVILVNDAISNVKDVEINSADLESLQKQIDKFESYKSLSEISGELKGLMKKYDKK